MFSDASQDCIVYNKIFLSATLFLSADPNIDREHAEFAEGKHQMACEAFGDGTVPKLETAVYKVCKKQEPRQILYSFERTSVSVWSDIGGKTLERTAI